MSLLSGGSLFVGSLSLPAERLFLNRTTFWGEALCWGSDVLVGLVSLLLWANLPVVVPDFLFGFQSRVSFLGLSLPVVVEPPFQGTSSCWVSDHLFNSYYFCRRTFFSIRLLSGASLSVRCPITCLSSRPRLGQQTQKRFGCADPCARTLPRAREKDHAVTSWGARPGPAGHRSTFPHARACAHARA